MVCLLLPPLTQTFFFYDCGCCVFILLDQAAGRWRLWLWSVSESFLVPICPKPPCQNMSTQYAINTHESMRLQREASNLRSPLQAAGTDLDSAAKQYLWAIRGNCFLGFRTGYLPKASTATSLMKER